MHALFPFLDANVLKLPSEQRISFWIGVINEEWDLTAFEEGLKNGTLNFLDVITKKDYRGSLINTRKLLNSSVFNHSGTNNVSKFSQLSHSERIKQYEDFKKLAKGNSSDLLDISYIYKKS